MSYGFGLPIGFRIGDLLALISAIIYSFYIIMVDILAKKVNAGALMFFVFIITGIISLPMAIIIDGNAFSLSYDFLSNLGFNTYYNMGFLIVLGTIIPYVFMGMGQRVIDAQTASLIYILEPLFAMVIAIIFFNEAPVITKFIGGGIILMALFIGVKEPKQKNDGGNLSNQKSQNS
jgi:drug/metabolite transporter (DMT)-like permease